MQTNWEVYKGGYCYGLDIHRHEISIWTATRSDPGGTGTTVSLESFYGGAMNDVALDHFGPEILAEIRAAVERILQSKGKL